MACEKKKILVLGSTGMLGSKVLQVMVDRFGQDEVVCSIRNWKKVNPHLTNVFCNPLVDSEMDEWSLPYQFEYVINCIGIIKPHVKKLGTLRTLKVNSVFPHELAEYCALMGTKLIQITTDCVFSGSRGQYTEEDVHDVTDLYGRSKSLGEPENCLTIRTSIIGEEQYNKVSLVEWAKSQKEKTVNGFVNHYWNGMTTKQYANICVEIIEKELFRNGIYHVFSPQDISKYNLLLLLNQKFDLGLKVEPVKAEILIDRTLATVKELNGELTVLNLITQIREM